MYIIRAEHIFPHSHSFFSCVISQAVPWWGFQHSWLGKYMQKSLHLIHLQQMSMEICNDVLHNNIYIYMIKQSCYRLGVAQRVSGTYGSQISWQQHRMVVRLSALRTGHLYPQEIHPVLISVRGWGDPRAIVWPEGLCYWKIPMTPSGFEPMTWFVA